jgi:hypothetical protein
MRAQHKNELIASWIERRLGVAVPTMAVDTLRRAALTLSRWGEMECGDEWGSCIERDSTTGKPFRYQHRSHGTATRYPIPDKERGALARIEKTCKEHGLTYYHQTDPRGAPLYVHTQPLTDTNYTNGVAVWVD